MTTLTKDVAKLGKIQKLHPISRKDFFLAVGFITLSIILLFFLASQREYFTFGTETDYVAHFREDAERFINNEPLELKYHPPLYSIIAGLLFIWVPDWLSVGVVISFASSIIVLFTSFHLMYRLAGRWAAWGTLISLMSSSVFLDYSKLATSDVLFFTLIMLSLERMVEAIHTGKKGNFVGAGIFVCLGFLTRSSGIVLLPLLLFPLLTKKKKWTTHFKWVLGGFGCVLVVWGLIVLFTGSPLYIAGNANQLALNVMPDLKSSGDGTIQLEGNPQYSSTLDVFLEDPKQHVKVFVRNLIILPKSFFASNNLLAFPLNLLALPGLFFLLGSIRRPSGYVYVGLALGYTLLMSLFIVADQGRFYLLWIPLFGAGIGVLLHKMVQSFDVKFLKIGSVLILVVLLLFVGVRQSMEQVHDELQSSELELAESVPIAVSFIESKSVVITRKPHIPFYTNSVYARMPDTSNFGDLLELADTYEGDAYLYYGHSESQLRPQFSRLLKPEQAPSWLQLVAKGEGWVLYKYKNG